MSFLIDTNAVSELRRTQPDPGVVTWFTQRPASSLFLSVLTLGELRKGIEKLEDPQRRSALTEWLDHALPAYFAGRILPIDAAIADRWGRLQASAHRPLPVIDSLLAATAQRNELKLVTRNTKDFGEIRHVRCTEKVRNITILRHGLSWTTFIDKSRT